LHRVVGDEDASFEAEAVISAVGDKLDYSAFSAVTFPGLVSQ
jgi:hypothetical protein